MAKTTTTISSSIPETTFRVVKLTDQLRDSFKSKRAEKGFTNQAMLEHAITESLPAIVDALCQLGFTRTVGKTRPARFPFSEGLLSFLKESSEKVGIPAQQLLLLCLAQQCPEVITEAAPKASTTEKATKPAKGQRRKAKAAPVARKPRATKK